MAWSPRVPRKPIASTRAVSTQFLRQCSPRSNCTERKTRQYMVGAFWGKYSVRCKLTQRCLGEGCSVFLSVPLRSPATRRYSPSQRAHAAWSPMWRGPRIVQQISRTPLQEVCSSMSAFESRSRRRRRVRARISSGPWQQHQRMSRPPEAVNPRCVDDAQCRELAEREFAPQHANVPQFLS